ncbi:MAG TPA: hypothetical protein VMK16_11895 [Acidimicrobiales bacterium]|nr:hypothetical protein [Acidimicrobiales bacterium]
MTALLVAQDVVKSFRTGDTEQAVLRGVSMTVDSGEWVAIMGPRLPPTVSCIEPFDPAWRAH